MVKLAAQQELTVEPNPLELHAGKVNYNISAVLPPKMLPSGKVYTIKNLYQYGDKELETGSVEFKADDFPSSSTSPSRKSAEFTFNYTDEMNPGKLMVQGVASDPRNGKTMETPKMEVALGIITTSTAVKDNYLAAYAFHGYNDKEELVPTNIDFFFEQGRSVLSPSIKTDGKSNRDKQRELAAFIADKNVTRTVTITGTHSPEGPERINSNLSQERAERIEDYYRRQMRRYDYKGAADSIKFILKPVVEDWTAFKNAIQEYDGIDVQTKTEWGRIINGSGTFEDKEKELKRTAADAYDKVFKEVYPTLRTAKTEILTVKEKKTPAEISVLAKQITTEEVSADTLSDEEMLYAATLTPSLEEKAAIYMAATKKSGSWVAHNNLAATYLEMAKMDADNRDKLVQDAMTQLEIAANKNKSPEVLANMGSAYVMQGNYEEAQTSLNDAVAKASNELKADIYGVRGPMEIRSGDYTKASATLNGASNNDITTFNKGLAALLSKDFETADDYFENIEDSSIGADASYHRAVAAARAGRANDVTTHLTSAVSKDSALKDKALNDLEFSKFADAVAQALR
jgi:tetratricopeptide (TPR) repeat protein